MQINGRFTHVYFYAVSIFLPDLVFPDCQMEKRHKGIMVESKHLK